MVLVGLSLALSPKPYGATIVGTAGDDVLVGTWQDDVIVGLEGDDTITGASGADTICGGPGNDTINSQSGADNVFGGPGDDVISGGPGDDVINAGPGNDTVDGNSQADVITGGDGDDAINGGAGDDVLDGGNGIDVVDGSWATDICDDAETAIGCETETQNGEPGAGGPDVDVPVVSAASDDRLAAAGTLSLTLTAVDESGIANVQLINPDGYVYEVVQVDDQTWHADVNSSRLFPGATIGWLAGSFTTRR